MKLPTQAQPVMRRKSYNSQFAIFSGIQIQQQACTCTQNKSSGRCTIQPNNNCPAGTIPSCSPNDGCICRCVKFP